MCSHSKASIYYTFFHICLATLLAVSITGCSDDGVKVDFQDVVEAKSTEADESPILRVAVAAMISPQETFSAYQRFLEHLGSKTGWKIQLVQRKTYGEINELLGSGKVDIAFICSGPYATAKNMYGFISLGTPVVRGKPFYQSYLIVNKDSRITSFEELRGHSFAFTDPDSNTGLLVPISWLQELGEEPQSFFEKTIFTYSHDNSLLAVSRGLVDGAAVNGQIWEYFNTHSPTHTAKTKIIRKSERFGNAPVVASAFLPAEQREQLRETLLSFHQDTVGKTILEEMSIDHFVPTNDEWYDSIRALSTQEDK